ncbi:MAG: beta-propeller fold lactonase family protein [Ignavibacteria bacterium]|nr:beta-propeller fold lactonase family protein [Ignavibacteria bacterium]
MMVDNTSCVYAFVLLTCSIVLSCKEESVQILPLAPRIESLFAINGNGSVTLGWTDVEGGTAAALQLYRSVDKNFALSNQTLLASFPPASTQFVDTGLINGQRYYYRIVPVEQTSGGAQRMGVSQEVATMARPYDYSSVGEIRFSEHIQPIFLSGCAVSGCHVGSDTAANSIVLKNAFHNRIAKATHDEKFSLKEWEDFFKGGDHGAIVIPYRSSKSHIVYHMNTDTLVAPVSSPHMPPLAAFNIPADQLRLIMRWIDQGAADDYGAVAFSVNPKGKILVANQAEDLVTVIDIATNLVSRYVQAGDSNVFTQVPSAPHHVRADRQGKFFYTTLINAQELWKFSAVTHQFVQKVQVPPSPADVILTAGGDTAIVTNFSTTSQIAALVDTRTMQVIKTFILPSALRPFVSFSHGALLSHDGQRLYITNQGSGNLIAISMTDGSMSLIALDTSGTPTSNTQPYLSDESLDGRYVYTSCYGTNEVRVIDRMIDTTRAIGIIPVGTRPLHVKFSPDGQYVLAANQGSEDVTFIRTSDFTTSTVSNIAHQPHGIEFSPDGTLVYITCENRTEVIPPHHPTQGSKIPGFVTVIDYASKQVIKTIEVGAFAAGVTVIQ